MLLMGFPTTRTTTTTTSKLAYSPYSIPFFVHLKNSTFSLPHLTNENAV